MADRAGLVSVKLGSLFETITLPLPCLASWISEYNARHRQSLCDGIARGIRFLFAHPEKLPVRSPSLRWCLFLFWVLFMQSKQSFASELSTQAGDPPVPVLGVPLTDEQAAALARLALAGLQREYPNKPANVMTGPATVLSPKQMHPAFYGCFDWHSSVHGHWMLIELLRSNPRHPEASRSRLQLSENLASANLLVEAAYFDEKENKSFERMYGWAWLLRLVSELHTWDDPEGKQWRKSLVPLETRIVALIHGYLPRLQQPIRTGVHPDTAFALGQILDYARTVGDSSLETLVKNRARDYYLADRDYRVRFEPSGEDFFSPCLNEADLMRRVLTPAEFANWLTQFLPELTSEAECDLLKPVHVSDLTDGKLVHLAGLDLSRAWCMLGVLRGLPNGDARIASLKASAEAHLQAGFQYVFSGHYEGEHWLGTFAVYALKQGR